ncbi:hypothetical protein AB4254_11925 [Vibrio breoganii]
MEKPYPIDVDRVEELPFNVGVRVPDVTRLAIYFAYLREVDKPCLHQE